MRSKLLLVLLATMLLPLPATAQTAAPITAPTELPGVHYASPNNTAASSTARFAVGLSLDSGLTYTATARVTDKISITGKIRPEASHIGMTGNLFVVDFVNGAWTMRNSEGVYVPWNFQIPALVPYKVGVTLGADIPVDVYTGALGTTGNHLIYIGYKPQGGDLYYTPAAKLLTFTQLNATDQAYSMFVANISPNLVQSRCSLCHVKGGIAEAGGASHIFQLPLATSLETNFRIFQNLVTLRGVNYILTKVTGGNGHGGGVQLTSNSVDYKDLSTFLNLVAQDLPPPTMTPDMGSDPYASNPYGYAY